MRLQTGQASSSRLHAEIGSDFDSLVAESVADNAAWIEACITKVEEMKQRFGSERWLCNPE